MDRPRIPMSGGIEERRATRHALTLDVSVEAGNDFYVGLTRNLSEGGIFVATEEMRDVGEQLTLRFALPDGMPPLDVRGEVRWQRTSTENPKSQPIGFGVRFVDLPPDAAKRIHAFLADRHALLHPDD